MRRLVLVAAAALAAFTSSNASAQTLKVVMHSDVKVLDPIWSGAYITRNHGYMLYDVLFAMDEKFQVKPQMVDTWTTSDDGKAIEKSFRFKDFSEAFAFLTRVALHAEKVDHHPEFTSAWNRLHFRLTTHDADEVTGRDTALAEVIDRLARHPKGDIARRIDSYFKANGGFLAYDDLAAHRAARAKLVEQVVTPRPVDSREPQHEPPPASRDSGAPFWWIVSGGALALAGLGVGSTGLQAIWTQLDDPVASQIVWDIRAPRTVAAFCAGALLGLAGAVAQGLFRNPLADPFLLGSASGASLGVALALAAMGGGAGMLGGSMMNGGVAVSVFSSSALVRLGLTGAAFGGAVLAVLLTLVLSRGVQHTLRLLLAGVVVGVVLAAMTHLVLVFSPESLQAMQAFMLGSTSFVGWTACVLMAGGWALCARWQGLNRAGDHAEPMATMGLIEDAQVVFRGPFPCHRSAGQVGGFAHRLTAGIVAQQSRHGLAGGLRVAERHQKTAAVGQQFARFVQGFARSGHVAGGERRAGLSFAGSDFLPASDPRVGIGAGRGSGRADPDRQDQPQGAGRQPERPAHARQGPWPAEQGRRARVPVRAAQGRDAQDLRRRGQGAVAGTGEESRLQPTRELLNSTTE